MRLGRIGFDKVVGYLQEGLLSLAAHPELTATIDRLSPEVAARRLAANDAPQLVDVRTPREHEAKHIAGSLNIPLNHLAERAHELSTSRPLIVHCAGGYRSAIAASLLQQLGHTSIGELAGGVTAWETAELAVVKTA
jgi:rhodanese-related sulfurtransferase